LLIWYSKYSAMLSKIQLLQTTFSAILPTDVICYSNQIVHSVIGMSKRIWNIWCFI